MIEFARTVMGHRFFERDIPKLVDGIGALADAGKRIAGLLEMARQERSQSAADVADDMRLDAEAFKMVKEVCRRDLPPSDVLNRVKHIVAGRIP